MTTPSASQLIWLAADYHFAGLYSCRVPLSSMTSVSALPGPCPSTVRLALIRTGIELFGIDDTRNVLFPIIRAMKLAIRPPERVAITMQHLRMYKASTGAIDQIDRFDESIANREFAHAMEPMTVYLKVPDTARLMFHFLLSEIGYWGQASSLTQCIALDAHEPNLAECLTALQSLSGAYRIQDFVVSLATEFRSDTVEWSDITPPFARRNNELLMPELYIWPMVVIKQHRGNHLLVRRSIW
jgi:hypothetical protein